MEKKKFVDTSESENKDVLCGAEILRLTPNVCNIVLFGIL
jgi:hypothetical protein